VRIIGGDGQDQIADDSHVRGLRPLTKVYDVPDTDLNLGPESDNRTSTNPAVNRYDREAFEEAGVKLEKGFISVDEAFKTSVDGVYAIGDAITVPDANWDPHPQLAHVAFIEGQNVAERIAGQSPPPVDYRNIAHCIYCQPEVASVGLTQEKAEDLGMDVVTGQYQFSANARAQMLGGGQGFVKTVAQKDGAVVGVHIVGPRASDLISEAMLVTSWEAFPTELSEIIHPHPTLSEAIGETFMDLAGKPLHG